MFRAGRLAQAEKALLRSVWLDKTDATALLDLGHLLARQLRHGEARVRFQQANAPTFRLALLALSCAARVGGLLVSSVLLVIPLAEPAGAARGAAASKAA